MTQRFFYPTTDQPIKATLQLPGSKSITNRVLLIAALAKGTSFLQNILESDDTRAMKNALTALGVQYASLERSSFSVEGCGGRFPKQTATINCQDAGTVLRFLLPVCAYQSGIFKFEGTPQLTGRPIKPLIEVLEQLGATFQYSKNRQQLPFTMQARAFAKTKNITISSQASSQFLSGLILAAPLAQSEMVITTDNMVSEPYVNMTCKIMSQFGVEIQRPEPHIFHILPDQHYQNTSYVIEPDLSTASYFFAAAAITNGAFTLTEIDYATCLQGDVYFLTILEQMGCKVHWTNKTITLIGTSHLKGIDVNIKHCSDLFMTLACVCAFAKTPSTISGIQHIRLKESDRLKATQLNLETLGIQIIQDEHQDKVTILPSPIRSGTLESYGDHRMVMAFALCGLKQPNIAMNNASCVAKTCPDFLDHWTAMMAST